MPAVPENGEWRIENGGGLGPSSVLHHSSTLAQSMPETAPNPELLGSLSRLVRGLSALFWGLPAALVICVQTAKGDWFEKFGTLPPLAATILLFYGLGLLGYFQKQERVWRAALERAKVFAVVNVGLSPFLYWWSRMPSQPFFNSMIELMMVSGLLFLFALNPVLWRLAAMLPDETLRLETKLFTTLNRYFIVMTMALLLAYYILTRSHELPQVILNFLYLLERTGVWLGLFMVLLPVATTMALIWKIKETILISVFGPEH
jgi:hypothetical protein